jgi:hypothetical protein
MAKFSQMMLQGMLDPSRREAYSQVGQNIGQIPGIMALNRDAEAKQAETQRLLQENANNPARLQQLAQEYLAKGDKDAAEAFTNAATQATARRTAQVGALEQGGADIQKEAQRKRAMQVAMKDKNENALVALRAGALDPVEYLSGRASAGGVETVSVSPGGALVERGTGKVLYERPFKPEAAPASKGIKTVEREDGSVSVLDADDGSLISTLPPPDTTDASQEASLNLIAQTTGFIKEVDDLMDPGFFEAGIPGAVLSTIAPGTGAYDREKELLSIRARLGFDQINEMKRLAAESGASGTGLGQISNIEFMSLQSTIDAIYVGMSAEAQNKALENIKKHLLNVQQLASGVAPADAIDWSAPEYKATGYHQDPETGTVFYAPNGKSGTVYKLVNGKFVKVGA